jgi:ferredoxin
VLLVLQEEPPDGVRSAVDKAVRFCPTGALRIEEA